MITRSDVAKYAGVSNTTVSRVLNNNGYVSPESRVKVEAAIRELGYTPNLIARSLKTKRSGQLLYCMSEFNNPFYMEVYAGMEDYARKHGYAIVVASDFDASVVAQRQFDGIILSNTPPDLKKQLQELDIPVIVNNYTSQQVELPSIKIDIESGAHSALTYLLENGHRYIAFLTSSHHKCEQRYSAFMDFLSKEGFSHPEKYVISGIDASSPYEYGYKGALRLLEKNLPVTALFVFNDVMAIGALSALQEKNIAVPDELSVVSFDNILQSRYTVPSLSTVDIPKYELGEASVRMLLKMLNGEQVQSFTLKTQLAIRNSVKDISADKKP